MEDKERAFIELETTGSESYRRFLVEQYKQLFGLIGIGGNAPAALRPEVPEDVGEDESQAGLTDVLRKLYFNRHIRYVCMHSPQIREELEDEFLQFAAEGGSDAESWLRRLERRAKMAEQVMMELGSFGGMSGGLLWGKDEGRWSITDVRFLKKYQEFLDHHEEIREIARMLGRIAEEKERWITEHFSNRRLVPVTHITHAGKSELVGIHESDDLGSMLPTEVALLATEATQSLFYRRFAEKKLQTFDFIHREKRMVAIEEDATRRVLTDDDKPGPVIICLDTSGSMTGQPEITAKAMCLALLNIALTEHRKCFLITFSSGIETIDLTDMNDWTDLVDFISHGFHGGTDIDRPLAAAIDMLVNEDYRRADIMAISDFCAPALSHETLDKIVATKESRTRYYALSFNSRFCGYFDMSIFDHVWNA